MRLKFANYPALEDAFLHLAGEERSSATERILAVCPSDRVSARLKRALALRYGAMGNVRFVSFGRLLKELDAEAETPQPKLLPNDDLHDFILRELLARPQLNRYAPGRGFIKALKNSLRDLGDSLAEPDVLREYVSTAADPRVEADRAHLLWLCDVYTAYLQAMERVPGYRSYAAFFKSALERVEHSAYLQAFAQVVFYGFYDMTGRQLELFTRIAQYYPVTVFAPYEKTPGFAFAEKFFASIYQPAQDKQELPAKSGALGAAREALFVPGHSAACPALRMVQAPGVRGEVFFAAKQILKLVEEDGYKFSDIAVFARGTEEYRDEIFSVFGQNKIALDAAVEIPLLSTPLGIFCLNLFGLAANNFARETVLAVVTSPYFSRKNNWRYLINASLACRDYSQWTDLITPQTKHYDPAFLSWLENCKNRLEQLDQPLDWGTLCDLAQEFLQENIAQETLTPQENEILRQVFACVDCFKRRRCVREQARPNEFTPDLMSALNDLRLPKTVHVPGGVVFTDALGARGLQFKVVFLLGLNEKSFPRIVPEDPVLKDYFRARLRDGLGFWLNLTRARLEEEKLLFYILAASAGEKLFVCCQSADDSGTPKIPSLYFVEMARAACLTPKSAAWTEISGRVAKRLAEIPVRYLTPKELSTRIALAPAPRRKERYQTSGLLTAALERSLTAVKNLAAFGVPTAYDGQIACGGEILARVNEKGFSPSALITLAQCPMRHFLARGVGLAAPDEVLSRQEWAPNAKGSAYHAVLARVYGDLYQEHIRPQDLFPSALEERVKRAVQELVPANAYKQFGIYPVVWELIRQELIQKITDFVVEETPTLGSFVPGVFETEFEAVYTAAQDTKIKIHGIVDRVDLDESSRQYQVADYKSSIHTKKGLEQALLADNVFQPFLYAVMLAQNARFAGWEYAGSCLLELKNGYKRKDLSRDGFDEVKPQADGFFACLMRLIKKGDFYLEVNENCAYCPFSGICRKDAFKTRLRARHSAAAAEVADWRKL